tara:strand:- start:1358 stop:3580 length:2223 start_codon:yes stop_codon:yes gene_type:complete
MKHLPLLLICASLNSVVAQAQCEADATVYLTDFLFTPSEFTISVGQTVAFVNAEGTHNVDGTAESNPVSFFLEETEGNIDGVCMGTVTFDVPGVYTYTSSIGVQPELGMTGTIIVDAETLCDVMLSFWGSGENQNMDAYASAYAFQSYFGCSFFGQSGGFPGSTVYLEGLDEYTLFLPNSAAIEGLQELMNLNSFDLLYFTEGMVAGLSYHMVPGVFLAEDLQDGAVLPTVEGQDLSVSVADDGGIMLNGATVLHEDILAFNGVIHVIDEILVPAGYPSATTWDVIVQSPDHTIFEQALLAEGLDQALRGQPILNDNEPAEGPFTVFAPTDDAFFAMAEANGFESVDALLSSQFIDNIVDAHIVPGVYESTNLFNGMNLASYDNSGTVNIAIDDNGVQANTAPVIQADMLAYNGVVHSLGEVMLFDFPDPEGTCGAWTITMTCGFGGPDGWEGSSLHVFADGIEVASETMLNVGSESFSIPVDIGHRIDVVYNDDGWGQYHDYYITDNYGNVVFSSDDWGVPGDDPCNVYGLNPCDEDPTCGLIEITFTDDSGDGWYFGNLGVYSESGLEANIFFNPDFDGDGYADYIGFSTRTAVVTVDEGEVDFLVTAPIVYPTQCGYTVKNPEGDIVIDESSTNAAPPSTLNYVICESAASSVAEAESTGSSISIFPNPVSTTVQLQGLSANEAWEVDILRVDGKLIHRQSGIGSGIVDVSHLPGGLYALQLNRINREPKVLRFLRK